MIKLRQWQQAALPLALASLDARRNGVVVATTGAGKSIFLAALLVEWRKIHGPDEGVIIVTTPSIQLVRQLGATLAEHLPPGSVGLYYTRAKQHGREIVVCCNASVPALLAVYAGSGRKIAVWIADECHKTASDNFQGEAEEEGGNVITSVVPAERRLGLTATPFRSEEDERLALFDEVVYRYAPADALRDGVIVPWRIVGWGEDREDQVDADVACRMLIEELGDRQTRGPGVVNAYTIDDAVAYAETLTGAGIVARPIHSQMPEPERAANIRALREGEIDCLVHVAMLVEGVDFPWLRWLCLRRVVGARVRFIQEVGRVLRSDPASDKHEAVLLDPHDLFGAFQLSYEAALGWEEPEDEVRKIVQREADECADRGERDPVVVMAARTTAVSRYLRQLTLALVAEGKTAAVASRPGGWRNDPISEKQAAAITKMGAIVRRCCAEHAAMLGKIVEAAPILTRGAASDLFELLRGLRGVASGKVWRPASPVPLPPDVALEPVVDARTYVAGAVSREGLAAVAIVRAGRVLYEGVRTRKPDDSWAGLTARAIRLAVDTHGCRQVAASMPAVVARVGGDYRDRADVVLYVCDKAANPAERRVWALLRRSTGAVQRHAVAS